MMEGGSIVNMVLLNDLQCVEDPLSFDKPSNAVAKVDNFRVGLKCEDMLDIEDVKCEKETFYSEEYEDIDTCKMNIIDIDEVNYVEVIKVEVDPLTSSVVESNNTIIKKDPLPSITTKHDANQLEDIVMYDTDINDEINDDIDRKEVDPQNCRGTESANKSNEKDPLLSFLYEDKSEEEEEEEDTPTKEHHRNAPAKGRSRAKRSSAFHPSTKAPTSTTATTSTVQTTVPARPATTTSWPTSTAEPPSSSCPGAAGCAGATGRVRGTSRKRKGYFFRKSTRSVPTTDAPPPIHAHALTQISPQAAADAPLDPITVPSNHTPMVQRHPQQPQNSLTSSKFLPINFLEGEGEEEEDDIDNLMGYGLGDDSDSVGVDSDLDNRDDNVLYHDMDSELEEGDDDQDAAKPLQELSFAWSEGSDFIPDLYHFDANRSGATADWPCDDQAREIDFFRAFFDLELMTFLASQTNSYYRWVFKRMDVISPKARIRQWVDTTPSEVLVFIALLLIMTLCKKHNFQDYWKNDPMIATPIFGKFMCRDRFLLLLSFMHFADNDNPNRDDHIWKVREVLSMLLARFKKFFYPFHKLGIEDSLVLFKGRFGIKLCVLRDCETGIVLDMIPYTGTDIDIPKVNNKDPLGMSGAIVKQMMAPYIGKGHILYTDNWYTSPALSQYLHDSKTGSCGTVRLNRRFMPKFIGELTHLDNPSDIISDDEEARTHHDRTRARHQRHKKSDTYTQREKSGKLVALKWNDRRPLHMLSTVHTGAIIDTGKIHHHTRKRIKKPDMVVDYTQNMHFVDKSDCQLSGVECLRKSVNWSLKFFIHLVDVTMLNAYNMWLVKREQAPCKRLKFREFVYNVAYQILEKFGESTSHKGQRTVDLPDRIQEAFTRHVPIHTETLGNRRRQVQCYVCKNTTRRAQKRIRCNTMCKECNVGLCLGDCFQDYHTLKNY